MSEWIAMADKRPENYDTVLICAGDRMGVGTYLHRDTHSPVPRFEMAEGGSTTKATHWMELPAPPPKPISKDEALRLAIALLETWPEPCTVTGDKLIRQTVTKLREALNGQ